jgi:poly-gamma-glutamate synthesis protein (capsule biosynthesis protein)
MNLEGTKNMSELPGKGREEKISLVAVGDISLGGAVDQKFACRDIFEFVKDELSSSDVSIGNLECVLGKKGRPTRTYTHLRAHSGWVKHLKIFKILNLANNHIMDFGKEGIDETISLLRKENILTIGAGGSYQQALRPIVLEIKSIRIGFLGFVYDESMLFSNLVRARSLRRAGPARYNEFDVLNLIQKLKKKTHLVIVSIHWGRENVDFPSLQQRLLAQKLIANGVDIILGHHPHEAQGVEKFANGLVFYSLGNCIFDPALSKAKYGLMVKLSLCDKGILDYTVFPLGINHDSQPFELTGDKFFNGHFERISKVLENYSANVYNNWWFEQTSERFLRSYRSNVFLIKRFGLGYVPSFLLGLILPYSIKYYAGYIRYKIRKLLTILTKNRWCELQKMKTIFLFYTKL